MSFIQLPDNKMYTRQMLWNVTPRKWSLLSCIKHLNITCDSELAKTGGDVIQCFDRVLEIFASCSTFLRMWINIGKLEIATTELKGEERERELREERGNLGFKKNTCSLPCQCCLFSSSVYGTIDSKTEIFLLFLIKF